MDEPTSGLDSTAAADILSALTRVARLGANIVTVVHQARGGWGRAAGGEAALLIPLRRRLPDLASRPRP